MKRQPSIFTTADVMVEYIFRAMLRRAESGDPDLYLPTGRPRHSGARHREVFWLGAEAEPPPESIPEEGTLLWACFRAGQVFHQQQVKRGEADPK